MPKLLAGLLSCLLTTATAEAGVTRLVSNWAVLIIALWYVAVLAAIWFEFGTRVFG